MSKLSPEARELVTHAENDQDLYKRSHTPIVSNLKKKAAKGKYDHDKAQKLWKLHADRAAHSYAKQHGSPGQKGHHIFSVKHREEAAKHFADKYKEEVHESYVEESDQSQEYMTEAEKWIQKANLKKGALKKQLGVPEDETIPKEKLEKAAKEGGTMGRRARLAMTLSKLSKAKKMNEENELNEDYDSMIEFDITEQEIDDICSLIAEHLDEDYSQDSMDEDINEGKLDDLRDKQELERQTRSSYDKTAKKKPVDMKKVRQVLGGKYGGSKQKSVDDEE